MNITRYTPWYPLSQLQNEVNRLFQRDWYSPSREDDQNLEISQWLPLVDIEEKDNCFIITADIPGVEPDKIDIAVDGNFLTISGCRTTEKENNKEGYLRLERLTGSFRRQFSLPDSADLENIQAKNKHGELVIILPKKEKKASKRIQITAE